MCFIALIGKEQLPCCISTIFLSSTGPGCLARPLKVPASSWLILLKTQKGGCACLKHSSISFLFLFARFGRDTMCNLGTKLTETMLAAVVSASLLFRKDTFHSENLLSKESHVHTVLLLLAISRRGSVSGSARKSSKQPGCLW